MRLNYHDNDGFPSEIGVDINYLYSDADDRTSIKGVSVDIYNTETEAVLARGTSLCNPVDNFNKALGRKIAFQRAVDELTGKKVDGYGNVTATGDRDLRVQLWRAFVRSATNKDGVKMP